MTPQNLLDYVKVYENHFSKELCESVINDLNTLNWEEHFFYKFRTNESVKYDNELSISYENVKEQNEVIKLIWQAIEKYILFDFKSFSPWFEGWTGFSQVRFNKYDPDTKMKLHCDHIHALFDGERKGIPILSIVGVFNDNYEGGEFIMFGDHEIKLPAGSVLLFPSNFMFPHEVKPIKSGTRYSCVSWTW